jgi:predicted ATPase
MELGDSMKINTVGAQGTGKTTFCQALQRRVGGVFIPSTAREALKYGYKLNYEADPISQLLTTVSRIAAETDADNTHKLIISDRTPVDSLAYTKYQIDHVWDAEDGNDFYWKVSRDIVRQHMVNAGYTIYVPITFAIHDDGVRSPDLAYQKAIDENVRELLDELQVKHLVMPAGSVQERVDWFINWANSVQFDK